MNTMVINGEEWVKKSDIPTMAEKKDGMDYVLIRTYSAGVHAGYLKSRKGKEVELVESRRIWYWEGAASLSELAMRGASKPKSCKFPAPVDSIILTEAIEVIKCSEDGRKMIQEAPVWSEK